LFFFVFLNNLNSKDLKGLKKVKMRGWSGHSSSLEKLLCNRMELNAGQWLISVGKESWPLLHLLRQRWSYGRAQTTMQCLTHSEGQASLPRSVVTWLNQTVVSGWFSTGFSIGYYNSNNNNDNNYEYLLKKLVNRPSVERCPVQKFISDIMRSPSISVEHIDSDVERTFQRVKMQWLDVRVREVDVLQVFSLNISQVSSYVDYLATDFQNILRLS